MGQGSSWKAPWIRFIDPSLWSCGLSNVRESRYSICLEVSMIGSCLILTFTCVQQGPYSSAPLIPFILGWPRSLFGFFHKILQKNPNFLANPMKWGCCTRALKPHPSLTSYFCFQRNYTCDEKESSPSVDHQTPMVVNVGRLRRQVQVEIRGSIQLQVLRESITWGAMHQNIWMEDWFLMAQVLQQKDHMKATCDVCLPGCGAAVGFGESCQHRMIDCCSPAQGSGDSQSLLFQSKGQSWGRMCKAFMSRCFGHRNPPRL